MRKRSLGLAWMICVLALASCVSPEELRREDEATCAGYGFHPGTDAFATCLQRESLARRALTAYPAPPYWGYWGYWGRGWGPYWPQRGPPTQRPPSIAAANSGPTRALRHSG
jgi:hypothetical protein